MNSAQETQRSPMLADLAPANGATASIPEENSARHPTQSPDHVWEERIKQYRNLEITAKELERKISETQAKLGEMTARIAELSEEITLLEEKKQTLKDFIDESDATTDHQNKQKKPSTKHPSLQQRAEPKQPSQNPAADQTNSARPRDNNDKERSAPISRRDEKDTQHDSVEEDWKIAHHALMRKVIGLFNENKRINDLMQTTSQLIKDLEEIASSISNEIDALKNAAIQCCQKPPESLSPQRARHEQFPEARYFVIAHRAHTLPARAPERFPQSLCG